jgi:hypothetical protein
LRSRCGIAGISASPTVISPMNRPKPDGDPALPAGLLLAPVIPYSREVQQPAHATAALGRYPHAHRAALLDCHQDRADSCIQIQPDSAFTRGGPAPTGEGMAEPAPPRSKVTPWGVMPGNAIAWHAGRVHRCFRVGRRDGTIRARCRSTGAGQRCEGQQRVGAAAEGPGPAAIRRHGGWSRWDWCVMCCEAALL